MDAEEKQASIGLDLRIASAGSNSHFVGELVPVDIECLDGFEKGEVGMILSLALGWRL